MLTKGPRNNIQDSLIKGLTEQLVDQRHHLGLTLLEVADKSGYAFDTMRKLEAGHRNPSLQSLAIWAETLGYDLMFDFKLTKKR